MGFNDWIFVNDNLNNILTATLALITVMCLHETLEGCAVRAVKVLRGDSVQCLLIMRSHGSLSKTFALFRGDPLLGGVYHAPSCTCGSAMGPDAPPRCVLESLRVPVKRRRMLFMTTLLRIVIIIIEVAVFCLAITRRSNNYLENGKWALTPTWNNFGQEMKPKFKREIGCVDMFPNENKRLNRKTQLSVCLRLHQPIETVKEDLSPAPAGFVHYWIYIDLSGDKVTLADANGVKNGAEMYAYWAVESELSEGVVPTIEYGKEYSMNRKFHLNATERADWRQEMDKNMYDILRDGYRTAYGVNGRQWGEQDGKTPRMLLYINFDKLPADLMKFDEELRVAHLLSRMITLQKFENGNGTENISHSDGVKIETLEGPIIEYAIIGQVMGVIPWGIVTVCVLLFRSFTSWLFPNNFYELLLETYGIATRLRPGYSPISTPPVQLSFKTTENDRSVWVYPFVKNDSPESSSELILQYLGAQPRIIDLDKVV